jgi:hypothetical protein
VFDVHEPAFEKPSRSRAMAGVLSDFRELESSKVARAVMSAPGESIRSAEIIVLVWLMLNGKQRGEVGESWQVAHAALVEIARERAGLDFEEGRWLIAAQRASVDRQLGYGSFIEYAERLFGYTPRVTQEKLRVAQALEALPELSHQLRDGTLTFSQVRELTRVATPETERIWAESARDRTSRQVERLVSGRPPGSLPDSPARPELIKRVLRFEVSNETYASFREAVAKLRRDAGEHLDDDTTFILLARHVLGGPTDDGRASYQVALDVCEDCQRGRQHADGDLVDVSSHVRGMASCDAQRLPRAHVGQTPTESPARAKQDVPPAVRREVLRRDHHRCRAPGCAHATFVDVHHVRTRADGGQHDPGNLITLCGAHHRAIHEGTLQIVGDGSAAAEFLHADGTSYGARPSAPVSQVQAQAFRALRGLGFGEREARQALTRALQDSKPGASLETVVRQCLALLTESAC